MAIKTVCPECQTTYQLADQQAGKKVRCKNCEAIFTAEPPSRQKAVRGEGGSPSPAKAKPTMMARREDLNLDVFESEEGGQTKPDPARNVQKKSALPMILGTAVVGLGLLLALSGAAITYLLMRDQSGEVAKPNTPPSPPPIMPPPLPAPVNAPANPPAVKPAAQAAADVPPVQGQTVRQPKPEPVKSADPPPNASASSEPGKLEKEANNGRLTTASREHVKRATVYIRVKLPDGSGATGSGFFGCKDAPSIILTNAHVVGMLSPESPRPLEVEVIVNSGEPNEWNTKARVLGVDRATDLAVLDIGTPPKPVPDPLVVKGAGGLHELDDVYVFGFPHGEMLGKEISMRRASVASFRRKNGNLERVQVEGGLDHGNSGGPIVDNSGAVVGVAVAVWATNKQIGLAIPGERVHAILSGRIADLIVQQPYFTEGNKIAVPVLMGTIDPRNLLKEVGLEIWTGNKPPDAKKAATRPESTTQPRPQPGDSAHVLHPMKYLAPEGKASIVLPNLPKDKVYWAQARWINSKGETHWEAAKPLPELPQPVYRKPAKLELHYSQGAKRALDLTLENIFRVSDNDDAESICIRTVAPLKETVAGTGPNGTQLNLSYRFPPSRDMVTPEGRSIPSPKLEQLKEEIPRVLMSALQLDRLGNITRQEIDQRPLMQLRGSNSQRVKDLKEFHEMIQQGLEALSVSMPPSGQANPLDSWKAERHLPIDKPDKTDIGKLDATFTFLGTRRREGREEGVISMDGLVRGKDDAVGGRATGQIVVDLASGQTILAETTMKLQLRAILAKPGEEGRELRVILTMNFRMTRKRLV